MKPTILTIAIILGVLGQTKVRDQWDRFYNNHSWKAIQVDTMPVKPDTIPYSFKEVRFVVFRNDKYVDVKPSIPYSEIMEFWQDGYMVIDRKPHRSHEPVFLYADRKTKVTNHVIYYFER